jgi:hypothetical protein
MTELKLTVNEEKNLGLSWPKGNITILGLEFKVVYSLKRERSALASYPAENSARTSY